METFYTGPNISQHLAEIIKFHPSITILLVYSNDDFIRKIPVLKNKICGNSHMQLI